MFGRKIYDLRYKDMIWVLRDSFAGATATDSPEEAKMKKKLARNILIAIFSISLLTFFLWLIS
ncbi:hypothetical protein [Aminipila sp.]|uniref:hypothetical protein n=1 Tax=Aminipila sp. TaxID=2060095 RepID=UPI00289C2168|nr:hypothetical protein [Aminipila sp.]